MDKTAIKNFSIWARNTLMNDVRASLGMIGITEKGISSPLPASTREIQYFDIGSTQPSSIVGYDIISRNAIVSRLKQENDYSIAFKSLVESTASSWFNRLIAIRYMEVNDHFDDGLRVLSSSIGLKDPDLLSSPFDSDIDFSERETNKIKELMNDNQMDELFRYLLFKRCNQLHKVLPGLFERSGDASEYLIKLSYIDKDGVISHLVHDIDEEDWKDQVQIIGWMYQYYNSELKDETFALLKKNQKISKERVPSATQLFTPDWIVRYMVENSLGRLWIEGHPEDNHLKENWKYYLEEAEQEPIVQKQLTEIRREYSELKPEDLSFIDPCMGSGHILVYAFDVLMQIYEAQGYTQRDAAQSILKNNLYGLDIDDRAYQLAYFAVMMKAKQYDRRILSRDISPRVYSIQESNNINRFHLNYLGFTLSEIQREKGIQQMSELLNLFVDAKEYGSILRVDKYDWESLRSLINSVNIKQLSSETVGIEETQKKLLDIINCAQILSSKYWIVCTNPPYMGISNASIKLNQYAKDHFASSKSDLSTIFMSRSIEFCLKCGMVSMINIPVWMTLSTYEPFRKELLNLITIHSLIHFGRGVFGSDFGTVAFCFKNYNRNSFKGIYLKLFDKIGNVESLEIKEKRFFDLSCRKTNSQSNYSLIPGCSIAYNASDNTIKAFSTIAPLKSWINPRSGISTGDNEQFYRFWFECNINNITFDPNKTPQNSDYKWFPIIRGGDFRKWYGNMDNVINLQNDGFDIRNSGNNYRLRTPEYYNKLGITWNRISMRAASFRLKTEIVNFGENSPCMFLDNNYIFTTLGLLNSKIAGHFLQFINSSMTFQVRDIELIPLKKISDLHIERIVKENIGFEKEDWDSFETSWDFSEHPLVKWSKELWDATSIGATMEYYYKCHPTVNSPLELCYMLWKGECNERFNRLKEHEEELNRIFIEIYGLEEELTPNVEEKDITVRKADLKRDIKSFISYAIGCMFGRYSLDVEGLAYAGGDWNKSKYRSFIPDSDNIIPITDEKYLSDDLAERFFDWVSIVFGDESLDANLQYIADALGGKGNSRDIIRNYLVNDFFSDHCSTYSVTGSGKRPIYWLFDSGKRNGFKALIYMHRYTPDTIGRVRVNYLHKIQEKYENEVRAIETFIDSSSDQKMIAREQKRMEKLLKQIEEVKAYDEKLEHLAAENIEINLDDGVKQNYEKVQTDRNGKKYQILAPIK